MAVIRDATSSGRPYSTGNTFAHTVASQDNRFLLVSGSSNDWVERTTAVSYAGIAMTKYVAVNHVHGGDNIIMSVWGLVAPAIGTNNVQVTFNSPGYWDAIGHSYYGVDQSDPYDTTDTIGDNNHGHNITLQAQTGGMAIDMFGDLCGSLACQNDSTEWRENSTHCVGYNEDYDNGSKTMSGTGNFCREWPHISWGMTLQPPQNLTIDMSGYYATAVSSALIGTVDDGNISINMSASSVDAVATITIGNIAVLEPLEADMHIGD